MGSIDIHAPRGRGRPAFTIFLRAAGGLGLFSIALVGSVAPVFGGEMTTAVGLAAGGAGALLGVYLVSRG